MDNPFQSLLRSIVYQQLNSKAAATIHRRLLALFPGEHPDPDEILDTPDEVLRSAGLSRNKTAAAKDLARRTLDGTVPPRETLLEMADDEVIERLTLVRGVGPWTAEMVLIFQLGRPDVLAATDYGVRNGFRRAYGLEELPTPRELRDYGERWAPVRSIACWYLWRAADLVEWTAPKGTGWAGSG
jgi:DNA-3-methyladenine glycosylase II